MGRYLCCGHAAWPWMPRCRFGIFQIWPKGFADHIALAKIMDAYLCKCFERAVVLTELCCRLCRCMCRHRKLYGASKL
jgi:hypothetical protein